MESLLCAGTWTYDLQSREITWSPGLYRLLGLDPNVVAASLGLYESLVHPDDRISHDDIVELAGAEGPAARRFRMIRPDGHMIWLESRTEVQYDRQGRLAVVHGVVQDVSGHEKLRLEHARLTASSRSMRKITGGEFWRADPDGQLLDMGGWVKFTGRSAEELRDFDQLPSIHPEDREPFRQAWTTGIRAKDRIELKVRVRRHDGVYHRFESVAVPVLDAEGVIAEWHGMSRIAEDTLPPVRTEHEVRSPHVRAARALLDLSAQELARIANVSFSTIRRLEADASTVRPESVEQVRRTLESRGVRFERSSDGHVTVSLPDR
jgi:PAS domain S-box-containing protein